MRDWPAFDSRNYIVAFELRSIDDCPPDFDVSLVEPPAGVGDRCCDLVQFALGRFQQVLALSRSFGGEVRVAGDHEVAHRGTRSRWISARLV